MSEAKIAALPQANSSAALIQTDPLMAMIERAARDPSIDMDRLERLLAMKERAELKAAEGEYNDAMALVQAEMTPIARDSNNPQTRSKYASYHAIDKAVRPIYTKRGFRVSFDEEETAASDMVRVIAIVTKGRHAERYHYDSPIITKGMKGNEMMTLTHARASADTYAKRYLMGRIFNLSTGEDDDGNAAGMGETITMEQMDNLIILVGESGADMSAFCRLLKVDNLKELPLRQFPSAIALLKAKKSEAKKAKEEPLS
jgi:hypothetical protein